jgi:non-heme chloroperoxidase
MMKRLAPLAALALIAGTVHARPADPVFPAHFDAIGSPVQAIPGNHARTIHYTDTGEAGWHPLLYVGGAGTSARASEMVGFLDTLRRRMHVRIITVERNGFGDSAYDPAWGFDDYTDDVRRVLAAIKVDRFALVAISGGGAYAGHIVAAMPDRITSWHMMAAVSGMPGNSAMCTMPATAIAAKIAGEVAAPRVWWDLPATGVAAHVHGFAERAADEGAHAFFIGGQKGDPRGMADEYLRFCAPPADVSRYRAPAYFYYGEADHTVPPSHGERWAAMVKGPVIFRRYPGEGHDVQYRHWDQLLLDVGGFGGRTLVCHNGKAELKNGVIAPAKLPAGATLGVCAWGDEK